MYAEIESTTHTKNNDEKFLNELNAYAAAGMIDWRPECFRWFTWTFQLFIAENQMIWIVGRSLDGRLSHRSDGMSLAAPFGGQKNSISLKLPTIYVFCGFRQLRVQQTLRKPRIHRFC